MSGRLAVEGRGRQAVSHLVLVPGLWLDGSSWDGVVPLLEDAGHTTTAITLPGMQGLDVDRSSTTLRDHVEAVVAAVDAASGDVVVIGHSAGCAVAWAAVDARPDRISRAVLVGGFPTPHGQPPADGFEVLDGEIPLPDWSAFDDADVRDLDESARTRMRAAAIPSPAGAASDAQVLHDVRRFQVPVTVLCPEFSAKQLRAWVAEGLAPVSELARVKDVSMLDLDSGHWPQLTQPAALVAAILTVLPE